MKRYFCAALLGLLLTGCVSSQYLVDEDTPKPSSITVPLGETLTINYHANPTTGFRWFYRGAGTQLDLVESIYKQNFTLAIGAAGVPGTRTLTFKAVELGKANLLLYRSRQAPKILPESLPEDAFGQRHIEVIVAPK